MCGRKNSKERGKLTIENVEEHWADVTRVLPVHVWITLGSGDITWWLLLLPGVATSPDSHGEDHERNPAALGSHRSAEILEIQQVAENESPNNLGDPVERVVKGTSTGVEVGAVHRVELVSVEPVRGEEHREEEDDIGVGADGVVEANELGFPGWVLHENDLGTILTYNLTGIDEEETKSGADNHEDDETDVCSVIHWTLLLDVDVLAEWNEGTDDSTHVKDHPEPRHIVSLTLRLRKRCSLPRDISSLALLRRITHHNSALCRPKQTSADTQHCTSKDQESGVLSVIVAKKSSDIERVTEATKGKSQADAEPVGDGSSEESDDGEGGVEGGVGVIGWLLINLSTSTWSKLAFWICYKSLE